MTGVVFVVSIDSEEVLDYEFKTLHCRECLQRQRNDKTSSMILKCASEHKCNINHLGTSDMMETDGAGGKLFISSNT